MSFSIRIVAGLLLAATGFVAGCGDMAIPPAGSYSVILLATEGGEADEWTRRLTPVIERELDYYVDFEKQFRITPIKASEMDDVPPYKNIVLCGVLDSSTDTGQKIIGMIGDAGVEMVRSEGALILRKQDRPLKNQFTLIITAINKELLAEVIETRGHEIPDILEEGCRERLRRHLLKRSQPKLSERLYRDYGFRIQIPSLYRMLSDDPEPPGIELIREPPTRILGIFWVDRETPPTLGDEDELFDMRANYVWKRYDKDQMDRARTIFVPARMGRYDSIRMSGYWFNDDQVMGGYYETYFIYDDRLEVLWAVDLLVLAPGKPKHPMVRELRALAETFRSN